MAKQITGNRTAGYVAGLSNETYTLVESASISIAASNAGISAGAGVNNINVNIFGDISASSAAVSLLGSNSSVRIGAEALISGGNGVVLDGGNSDASVRGVIVAEQYGVRFGGNSNEVENRGVIHALATDGAGFFGDGNGNIFTNQAAGVIRASYGVIDSPDADNVSSIINRGTIISDTYSIFSEGGDTQVVNSGVLIGNVSLGAGDDSFNGVGGELTGKLLTGAGDDMLTTDSARLKMVELAGQGSDTVRAKVSYTLGTNIEQLILFGSETINGNGNGLANVLRGNEAANRIKGLAGADQLYGNGGDDILTGGKAADIFHFASGDGKDTIMDYRDETDRIDVSEWTGITDIADLRNNHAVNQGADLLLSLGSDQILIKNMQKAQMDGADFVF
ncbi:Ca2+-binding RTX toxin-like protein [Rhizobium sp. SG_E_25_P2]|uniref:calcium-binding protein n=1 Tax=Rhizobium sp. SG_E_25_P2 TaxID=2879942 RepID=UPI002473A1C2|nr:hypothetical protein [Rhizobium sp. SG_E_25_P2]MDH6269886.1 Ca2+-binding RTX toxin-like protein [Rhizobium sp. SG_E_25_P2]